MLNFVLIISILMALMFASSGRAQYYNEYSYYAPFESLAGNNFSLNPALYSDTHSGASFLVARDSFESTFTDDGNAGLEQSAEIKTEQLGLFLGTKLSDGLKLGVSHRRTFVSALHSRDDRQDGFLEFHEYRQTNLQATLDLSADIKFGLRFRHLEQNHGVVGSFNTDTLTQYKSTLTGIASGLAFRRPNLYLGVSYLPPLVGKTDILNEELKITEPGLINIDGHYFFSQQFAFSFNWARWFYKRDDRSDGTTADDANDTPISINGLDLRQVIFPYESYGFGFSYVTASKLILSLSYAVVLNQIITDPNETPNPTEEDKVRVNGRIIKLNLSSNNTNYNLNIAVTDQSLEFDIDSLISNDGNYADHSRGLLLEAGFEL